MVRRKDDLFLFRKNLGITLRNIFPNKGYTKKSKLNNLLGCDWVFFKNYIEKQFIGNMSWNDPTSFTFDHIIPLRNAKTKEEIIKLFHYSNTQPLTMKDNLNKH